MPAHDPVVNPSVHYLGVEGTTTLADHSACIVQNARIMAERSDEYGPNGAYNFQMCNSHGIRFEGRGWNQDGAANGGENGIWYNAGSRSLCVLVGTDDVITDVCVAGIRAFANEAVSLHGMQWPLRGHSEFVATSCPGDHLRTVVADINANHGGPPPIDWNAIAAAIQAQTIRKRRKVEMFVAQDSKSIVLVTSGAVLSFTNAGDASDVMRYLGQDKPIMLNDGQLDIWKAEYAVT